MKKTYALKKKGDEMKSPFLKKQNFSVCFSEKEIAEKFCGENEEVIEIIQ